jgi:multidrug resistance efflux pump
MKRSTLLFRWLFNERSIIGKIYLLAFLQGAMYLIIPLGIQGVVTFIMAGSMSASLFLLCSIVVLAVIFIGILQIWQMRINETLNEKIFGDISARISHFINDSVLNIEIISRLNHFFEVVTLQKGMSKLVLDISFSVISIVFGMLILPVYNSWFLILTLILGTFFYIIVRYHGKSAINSNILTSNQKYRIANHFHSNEFSKKSSDSDFIKKADTILNDYYIDRKKHFNILEKQYKGIVIFKVVFIGILLFLGAFLVQSGELNIGQFIATELIIILVINSIEKLIISLDTCYDIITALYKIERIFNDSTQYSIFSDRPLSLPSFSSIYSHTYKRSIKLIFLSIGISGCVILFMPWTQNIESQGKVTTLDPSSRPQEITTRIAGRLEKWYIRDGSFVKKNDTIAFISEIKDEYMDPNLISRSEQQIQSKESAMESYEQKINAVNAQIDALNRSLRMKMEQTRNKIIQTKIKLTSDSTDAKAALNNYVISENQLKRFEDLESKGVVSKTDIENRRVKVQDAYAKKIAAENKYLATKNEMLNVEIELNAIQQDYAEKLMKADSDKFSVMSSLFEAEGSLTKLQNQLANYSMRTGFYYVLAPQDGYIHDAKIQGVGEIMKEGSSLCSIVPVQSEQVVELYINPIDLPLIKKGQTVQLTFDGWPAFVFSGWPGMSYGTFSSEIVAFDRVLSSNGKFRILAKGKDSRWPEAIQNGSGVKGFALLGNVPLIYEFWRQINGFPPEFYYENPSDKKNEKK